MNPSKKPRVREFHELSSSVSQSALRSILDKVQADGLPYAFSERTQRRQRALVAYQDTPFGPLLQPIDVGGQSVLIQHPVAMLWACCKADQSFATFLGSILDRDANAITIGLYTGEIAPSSQLDSPDELKSQSVYWSVLGFSAAALSQEEYWFELVVLRSDVEKDLVGRLPRLLRELLRTFHGRPSGADLRDGVSFHLPGEAARACSSGISNFLSKMSQLINLAMMPKGTLG